MVNWKARIRDAAAVSGHILDDDIVEELASHAVTAYETARAEGSDKKEAEKFVVAMVQSWINEAPRLRRRPRHPQTSLPAREDSPKVWFWPWLEHLRQDVIYGCRVLRGNPAFALTAVLTLALGIGANTAIFSIVNAVLLEPLPYQNPQRLVMVWESNRELAKNRDPVAPLNFQDWKGETSVFEAAAAYRYSGFVLTGAGDPERIRTLSTTASLFETLGVGAAIGRTFTEDEERKQDRVVVLSYDFWQRRFGGDRSLIGRSLNMGTNTYVVVGVMPPQFRFPDDAPAVETYSPLFLDQSDLRSRQAHTLTVVARLKDGVSSEKATAHMNQVARRITDAHTESNPEVALFGIHDVFVENARLALLVTFATAAFLLLIASTNVASLKLAQGSARGREIAVRASLGASRWRIMRQLVTESLLLSAIGGAAGLLVARWTIGAFVGLSPNLFGIQQVALDLPALSFTLVVSLMTGVLFGVFPAWQVSRANLSETIKTTGPTARRRVARSALVMAEVTLSIVLMVSAGLMIRSLIKLRAMDYGFLPENLFTMQLFVSPAKYPADPVQFRPRSTDAPPAQLSAQARLFNDLVDRLKAIPGVQGAAAVSALPLNPVGIDFDLPVLVEGRPRPPAGEVPQADFRIATSDYFATMGMRILQGRGFTDTDTMNTPNVVVINDTMARRFFGNENPVGRRIVFYGIPREVVGVIASVRHRGFRLEPNPEMIVPSKQFQQFGGMTLVLRSSLDSMSLERAIKRELRQIDPGLPLSNARTMVSFLSDSVAQPRLTTLLLASFALLGIVLACVGLYGVMSYGVTQRTQEIGIRMALGAERRYVFRMLLMETLMLVTIGVVCGLGAALVATRLMRGLLFGVGPSDPATYAVSALALILTALAAAYRPALHATRVDPLKALRHE